MQQNDSLADGYAPHCVCPGKHESVAALLAAGADPEHGWTRGPGGALYSQSVLDAACRNGTLQTVEQLLAVRNPVAANADAVIEAALVFGGSFLTECPFRNVHIVNDVRVLHVTQSPINVGRGGPEPWAHTWPVWVLRDADAIACLSQDRSGRRGGGVVGGRSGHGGWVDKGPGRAARP